MGKTFMRSTPQKNGVILDPRTKMLLVVTIATVLIGGGNSGVMTVIKPLLTVAPFLLLLSAGKWRSAAFYAIMYGFAYLGELFLVPITRGLLNFFVVAICGIFARFMPGIAMGSYLVNTTTVSQFMAVMERMRLPQSISIPISVMFRFFPRSARNTVPLGMP